LLGDDGYNLERALPMDIIKGSLSHSVIFSPSLILTSTKSERCSAELYNPHVRIHIDIKNTFHAKFVLIMFAYEGTVVAYSPMPRMPILLSVPRCLIMYTDFGVFRKDGDVWVPSA